MRSCVRHLTAVLLGHQLLALAWGAGGIESTSGADCGDLEAQQACVRACASDPQRGQLTCGADGQTYDGPCELRCRCVKAVAGGACRDQAFAYFSRRPRGGFHTVLQQHASQLQVQPPDNEGPPTSPANTSTVDLLPRADFGGSESGWGGAVSMPSTRAVASATGLGPVIELLSGWAEASPPASQSPAAVDTAPAIPLLALLPVLPASPFTSPAEMEAQPPVALEVAPQVTVPADLPPTANVTAAMALQSDLAAGSRPGAAGLGTTAPTAESETQAAVHEMLGSLAQLARKPLSVPAPRPAPQEEDAPAKAGPSTAKQLPLKDAL